MNTNMMFQVFCSIFQTFLMFGLGVIAIRTGMIRKENLGGLTRLALDVFFPFLTFSTILRNFTPEKMHDLWIMPTIGFGMMAAGGLAGFLFRMKMFHSTPERRASIHHICAINNYIFLPLIVLDKLWGAHHLALLLMMNVGSTIGFWTIGILTFGGSGSLKQSVKNIFSVNLAAIVLAVIMAWFHIPVPSFLSGMADMAGGMAVPFMLILTGAALWFQADKLFRDKLDALYITAVRLLILPAMLIFLLKLLPLERDVLEVCITVALMPAASASVLIAERYGGSTELTGQAIIITTSLSIITIPLGLWLAF